MNLQFFFHRSQSGTLDNCENVCEIVCGPILFFKTLASEDQVPGPNSQKLRVLCFPNRPANAS